MSEQPILLSKSDARLLRELLMGSWDTLRDKTHLQGLKMELERAAVLESTELPADVIRLYSRVQVLDLLTGVRSQYVLVLPSDGNVAMKRISVLAPLGTALLGYREGDEVEWLMPGGVRRLRVERVLQPDAAQTRSRAPRVRKRQGPLRGSSALTKASERAAVWGGQ